MVDSLKLYEALKASDLTESQAKSITQAISSAWEDQATLQDKGLVAKVSSDKFDSEMHRVEDTIKQESSVLRTEFSTLRTEFSTLRTEFSVLRTEFSAQRTEFAVLRTEFEKSGESVRADINAAKYAMVRWMFVFWIGQIGVVVAVIKLLK